MPLFLDGKRSIFDLKVKDEAGRWYIIEMQRKMERDYINRVQFYGSYSYVNQIEQGVSHKDLLRVSGRIGRKYTLRTKLKKSGERF